MRCTACTAWALHREGIAQVFGDTKVRDLDCWAQQRNCGANFHSPAILYAHHPPSILCEKDFERILSLSVSIVPWLCFLITVRPATSAWRSCVGCWLQKGSRRLLALTAPREFTRMLPKFDWAESRRRRQQCDIAACICRAKPWLLCISFSVDSKPRKLTSCSKCLEVLGSAWFGPILIVCGVWTFIWTRSKQNMARLNIAG